MKELIEKYKVFRTKLKAYNYVQFVVGWDSETVAPVGCFNERANQMGVISEESYKLSTSPEYMGIVEELFGMKEKLPAVLRQEIIEVFKDINKLKKIPMDEYIEFVILLNKSHQVWVEAKTKNNWDLFEPVLDKIITFERKYIKYLETDKLKGYNVLLDDYEPGFTMKEYDAFFDTLKKDLVPFVNKVINTKLEYNNSFLDNKFKIEKQKKFMLYLQKVMNYDTDHGMMKEAEHPFTSGFGTTDVRVTNHFYEDNLFSAIFSAIHELGHATYEMQCDPKLDETFVGGGASMAMHESQSRFYENVVGRSYEFWEKHYPKLQRTFKKELKDVTLLDFYKAINEAKASLIRVEADELTYPIHIMIRYDIEKAIFNDGLETKDIPKTWNKLYKDYLGVDVPNNTKGVLQDTHWAGSSFGYFPTYALGSAYAAQIYHTMQKELDMPKLMKASNLKSVNKWLKKKIHKYGASKYPKEILKIATGEDFDAKYYVNYLKEKYTKIYNLK